MTQRRFDSAGDAPRGRTTTAILLAGGLSRRFGSPKAFARLDGPDGRMFYERALDALGAVCGGIVVAASADLADRFPPELEVLPDLPHIAGKGPLAGICTAMRRRPGGRYLVMPCDMPLVGPEQIRRLDELAEDFEHADVAAVRGAEADIPLLSVWRRDLSDLLEDRILGDRLGVMKLLSELNTQWLDAGLIHTDERVFRNFNTPRE
ncbi:molybdenum cofactor guanylyltransferase [Saccharibacillus sp. CPCC 101409]|uniref:molybdenum cofactor guanylyltransferase n=1 Tax=Saccharibacillus sp. CPCC 101409 TaxID=3058041 RepID=UPI0026739A3F|nr:molybdenum cofactor guanylyltransferase [Saccharibacillus sp. CPCC 101409]MDO3412361.1 molybdenum cofactor guanylyltransferase [Saccharibacillus sp. CPCC 101409]